MRRRRAAKRRAADHPGHRVRAGNPLVDSPAPAHVRRAHTSGDRRRGPLRGPARGDPGGGEQPKGAPHARRHPAGAPRSGRALRPPDAPVEPEDEAVPLRGAFRDLHHRPRAVPRGPRGDPRVRPGPRPPTRHRAVHRHEEAGAGGRRRARQRASACPTSTTAGWAGCSPTSPTIRGRLLRLRELREMEEHRRDGAASQEGSHPPAPRAREARAQPRRHRQTWSGFPTRSS